MFDGLWQRNESFIRRVQSSIIKSTLLIIFQFYTNWGGWLLFKYVKDTGCQDGSADKTSVTKPEDGSLIPSVYVIGENRLCKAVPEPAHTVVHAHICTVDKYIPNKTSSWLLFVFLLFGFLFLFYSFSFLRHDRISLYNSPNCLGTRSVDRAGLELTEINLCL